jgi:hypothetical protein
MVARFARFATQIKLAKEIGSNQGSQQYLITIKQVDAGREVGLEMARAMPQADLKVIANAGDIQQGSRSARRPLYPGWRYEADRYARRPRSDAGRPQAHRRSDADADERRRRRWWARRRAMRPRVRLQAGDAS